MREDKKRVWVNGKAKNKRKMRLGKDWRRDIINALLSNKKERERSRRLENKNNEERKEGKERNKGVYLAQRSRLSGLRGRNGSE